METNSTIVNIIITNLEDKISNIDIDISFFIFFIIYTMLVMGSIWIHANKEELAYKFSRIINIIIFIFFVIPVFFLDIDNENIELLSGCMTSILGWIQYTYKKKSLTPEYIKKSKIKKYPLADKHVSSSINYASKCIEYMDEMHNSIGDDFKYENGAKINHKNFTNYLILRNSIGKSNSNEILAIAYKKVYDSFSNDFLKKLFDLKKNENVSIPVAIALKLRTISDEKYATQLNLSEVSFEDFYINYFARNHDNIHNHSERIFIIDTVEELKKENIKKIAFYNEVLQSHQESHVQMYCISKLKAENIINGYNTTYHLSATLDFSVNIDNNNKPIFVIANYGEKINCHSKFMQKKIEFINISIIHNEKEKKQYKDLFIRIKQASICVLDENFEIS